jgi:hypothetical protein
MSAISIDRLQDLKSVKSLDQIRKQFVFKLENRKRLDNYLSVCNALGFEKFCETCNPTQVNREIIKELIENQ